MSKRVLFAWEIGEGRGHVGPYLGLLAALREQGWEVALALKNTSVLGAGPCEAFPTVFQAPICTNVFSGISPTPASFAETCLAFGFAHAETLAGMVKGWRSLYALWRPNLLLANFAPASLLAARIDGVASIRLGTGFENPPPGAPLPLQVRWTPEMDLRLSRAETLALSMANGVLGDAGQPPAASLSAIVADVPTLLATLPELDFFKGRPEGQATFAGLLPPFGQSGTAPSGEADLFAYLQWEVPATRVALEVLAKGAHSAWVYLPDASQADCARLSAGPLRVRREPFDLDATLPKVRAVLGHGGHGTVVATLLHGKPSVWLPDHGERAHNARCVAELGCGVSLGPTLTPARLRSALAQVLQEAGPGERARAFAVGHREWRADGALSRSIEFCNRAAAPRGGLRIVGS